MAIQSKLSDYKRDFDKAYSAFAQAAGNLANGLPGQQSEPGKFSWIREMSNGLDNGVLYRFLKDTSKGFKMSPVTPNSEHGFTVFRGQKQASDRTRYAVDLIPKKPGIRVKIEFEKPPQTTAELFKHDIEAIYAPSFRESDCTPVVWEHLTRTNGPMLAVNGELPVSTWILMCAVTMREYKKGEDDRNYFLYLLRNYYDDYIKRQEPYVEGSDGNINHIKVDLLAVQRIAMLLRAHILYQYEAFDEDVELRGVFKDTVRYLIHNPAARAKALGDDGLSAFRIPLGVGGTKHQHLEWNVGTTYTKTVDIDDFTAMELDYGSKGNKVSRAWFTYNDESLRDAHTFLSEECGLRSLANYLDKALRTRNWDESFARVKSVLFGFEHIGGFTRTQEYASIKAGFAKKEKLLQKHIARGIQYDYPMIDQFGPIYESIYNAIDRYDLWMDPSSAQHYAMHPQAKSAGIAPVPVKMKVSAPGGDIDINDVSLTTKPLIVALAGDLFTNAMYEFEYSYTKGTPGRFGFRSVTGGKVKRVIYMNAIHVQTGEIPIAVPIQQYFNRGDKHVGTTSSIGNAVALAAQSSRQLTTLCKQIASTNLGKLAKGADYSAYDFSQGIKVWLEPNRDHTVAQIKKRNISDDYWGKSLEEVAEWIYADGIKDNAEYAYARPGFTKAELPVFFPKYGIDDPMPEHDDKTPRDFLPQDEIFPVSWMPSGSLTTAIINSVDNIANTHSFLEEYSLELNRHVKLIDENYLGDDNLLIFNLIDIGDGDSTDHALRMFEILGDGFNEVSNRNGFETNPKGGCINGVGEFLQLNVTHGMYIPKPTMDPIGAERKDKFADPIDVTRSRMNKFHDMCMRGLPITLAMKLMLLFWTFIRRYRYTPEGKSFGEDKRHDIIAPISILFTLTSEGGIGMVPGYLGATQVFTLLWDYSLDHALFTAVCQNTAFLDGRYYSDTASRTAELNTQPGELFHPGVQRIKNAMPNSMFKDGFDATEYLKTRVPSFLVNKIPRVDDIPERGIQDAIRTAKFAREKDQKIMIEHADNMLDSAKKKKWRNVARDYKWVLTVDVPARRTGRFMFKMTWGEPLPDHHLADPSPIPASPWIFRQTMKYFRLSSNNTIRFQEGNIITILNRGAERKVFAYQPEAVIAEVSKPHIFPYPLLRIAALRRMGFSGDGATKLSGDIDKYITDWFASTKTSMFDTSQNILGWIEIVTQSTTTLNIDTGVEPQVYIEDVPDKRFARMIELMCQTFLVVNLIRGHAPQRLTCQLRKGAMAHFARFVLKEVDLAARMEQVLDEELPADAQVYTQSTMR